MKRIATALLAALAIMPVSLCAADLAEGEAIYLVLENVSSEDGQAWLVEDTSGHKIIFRYIGEEEIENAAVIGRGSVLAITDNGISTRSLPPQMQALTVRDVTDDYYNGAFGEARFPDAPDSNPYTTLTVMPVGTLTPMPEIAAVDVTGPEDDATV